MKVFVIMRTNEEPYEEEQIEMFSVSASEVHADCVALFLTIIDIMNEVLFEKDSEETWRYWVHSTNLKGI